MKSPSKKGTATHLLHVRPQNFYVCIVETFLNEVLHKDLSMPFASPNGFPFSETRTQTGHKNIEQTIRITSA
eukprot:2197267-Amphidinium_carterae.1